MARTLRRLLPWTVGYLTLTAITAGAGALTVAQFNGIVISKFEQLAAAMNRIR